MDIKVGDRFGKLTIIKSKGFIYSGKSKTKRELWECDCDCGTKGFITRDFNLKRGDTKSCGCIRKEMMKEKMTKHNGSFTKLYQVWFKIKERCNNKNNKDYRYYGELGIHIYDEWNNSFESFRDWAINNGYEDGLTIERTDVYSDYTPSNCCWIPLKEQKYNKRNSIYVNYKNEKINLLKYCDDNNLNYYTIKNRIFKYGWDVEKAIELKKYENRIKKVICENVLFDSVKECSEYYKINKNTMRSWLNGQNKMPLEWKNRGLKDN